MKYLFKEEPIKKNNNVSSFYMTKGEIIIEALYLFYKKKGGN